LKFAAANSWRLWTYADFRAKSSVLKKAITHRFSLRHEQTLASYRVILDSTGADEARKLHHVCLQGQRSHVRLMRHQQRQVCVLHDVAGGAAENHLPQPVPCEGALDQQIAAFRLGRGEDRFTSAAAS
jgi:hypothetical protein